MPHTKSAKKRLRQNIKRRLQNRSVKRTYKTHVKRFHEALEGPVEEARAEFDLACKRLDKAAAKRVIHPNKAARHKSQMAKALHKKTAQPPAEA
jgi:small subunit ribosomal protein S20